jgi:hypothetical protein
MLCNWPTLAHRPIVPGVNLTFDDASNSAASERDIQSAGGFDIGQSGSFEGAGAAAGAGVEDESDPESAPELEESPELDPESLDPESLDPESLGAALPTLLAVERSFRAQPVPL